jgi:hypothetical protein
MSESKPDLQPAQLLEVTGGASVQPAGASWSSRRVMVAIGRLTERALETCITRVTAGSG